MEEPLKFMVMGEAGALLVFVSRRDYNLPPIIVGRFSTEGSFVDGQLYVRGLTEGLEWCVGRDCVHGFVVWLGLSEEAIVCLNY